MASPFASLPQLVVAGYRPTTFDYDPSPEAEQTTLVTKEQWIEVFRGSIPEFSKRAKAYGTVQGSERLSTQFADTFNADLDSVINGEHATLFDGPPTVLKLCKLRDQRLRELGFADCFLAVKTAENTKALIELPKVLQDIDAITDKTQRIKALVQGAFAGNVFDLGAAASAKMHADGTNGFSATKSKLKKRPWCVDDFDEFLDRWIGSAKTLDYISNGDAANGDPTSNTNIIKSPWKKVIVFVDNAGADVVLGMLPFCRELLKGGACVILAANEVPSINDITAKELNEILPRVAEVDMEGIFKKAMDSDALKVISSGSDLPVIDLTKLSKKLCAEAKGADLIVMEGMGRAVETNLYAKFTCDALNLGMVKHPEVATCLKGTLYDCVCRFRGAEGE